MHTLRRPDRRIARTRRALRSALIDLSLEKGFHRLTIRDLTERADIGYATFFRHFKSKDELTAHVLMTLIDDLEDRMEPGMTTYDEALTLYRFVLENKRIYQVCFMLPRSNPATMLAWERLSQFAHERYAAREDCEIPFDVSLNHLLSSIWELTRWWIQDAPHHTPEEIATAHAELIVKAMEQVAIDQRAQPMGELAVD